MNLNKTTMSSLDFLNNVINPFRIDSGETPHEPRKFLNKVEDELELDPTGKKFRLNNNQTKTYYYMLNTDQMMLVGMRESKSVRKSVLNYIRALEEKAKIPEMSPEQMVDFIFNAYKDKAKESEEKSVETFSPTEIGDRMGISCQRVNDILTMIGFQESEKVKKGSTTYYFYNVTIKGLNHGVNGAKSNTNQSVRWRESVIGPMQEYIDSL